MSKRKVGRPPSYTEEERIEKIRESQKLYHSKSTRYADYQKQYKLKKMKEKIIAEYDLDDDTINAIWKAPTRCDLREVIKL